MGEIEDLKAQGKDALEFAKEKAQEFEDFENSVKERLKNVTEELNVMGDNENQEFDDLEAEVKHLQASKRQLVKGSVNLREKKQREMRNDFIKLDKVSKWVGEYSQFNETNRGHLFKEITTIETMLFTARQRVARNVEAAE